MYTIHHHLHNHQNSYSFYHSFPTIKDTGVMVMVFNTTFNNISVKSWRSVFLVEETQVPGENHRQVTDKHYHIMLYRVLLIILVVIGTDYIGSCKSNYHTIMTTMAPKRYISSERMSMSNINICAKLNNIYLDYGGEENIYLNVVTYDLCNVMAKFLIQNINTIIQIFGCAS